jgi:hypothetical protein
MSSPDGRRPVDKYVGELAGDPRLLLQLDGRRRVSLGALATHAYYLAEVADDGVITLTPAEVVPLTGEDRG